VAERPERPADVRVRPALRPRLGHRDDEARPHRLDRRHVRRDQGHPRQRAGRRRMDVYAALAGLVGADAVVAPPPAHALADATESQGLRGSAEALVLPRTAEEVASVVAWCYERAVPIAPRGGGTGWAGGAVPVEGGIVLGLDRLDRVRAFDPLLWRMHVEAGVTTATVRRLARESGLFFPPDPGAAEQS